GRRSFVSMRLRLLTLFSVLGFAAWAQQPTGTITGTVSDPSGAAIVGAKVLATNLNTGLSRNTTTANDGGYVFPLVPVGFYSVTVEAQGFRHFEQRGVEVRTDESARVAVSLQIGSATQSVTVEANAQMVQTQSGALSEVVSQRKIVELPLNGRNAATHCRHEPIHIARGPST